MAGYLKDVETQAKHPLLDTMLLGRKKDCHVRLTDSRVSRQHAMIRRQDDGEYWFYDLGSSNGSYINDQRVITTRKLASDDQIRICDHEYTFDTGVVCENIEAEDGATIRHQSRYARRNVASDVGTTSLGSIRGEEYWAVYGGLNYYINKSVKLMFGAEYADLDDTNTGDSISAITGFSALRLEF